jgi:hypothetical protein
MAKRNFCVFSFRSMTIGSCRLGEGRLVVAASQRGFPAEAIERLGLQSSLSAQSCR